MSMLEAFRDSYSRRVFVALSLAALIICSGTLFAILRSEGKSSLHALSTIAVEVSASLIGAILTAGFILVLLRLVVRRETDLTMVRATTPAVTSRLHNTELRSTEFWYHNGHIGRWVRTTAIPELAARTSATGSNREVVLSILDPRDESLCQQYASYRRQLGSEKPTVDHYVDTLADLIATCLSAVDANRNHPGLRVEVRFKSQMYYERVDISSYFAFVTLADPKCNSICVSRSNDQERHGFYEALRATFLAQREADALFEDVASSCHQLTRTREEVKEFITANFFDPDTIHNSLADQSFEVYKSNWNPFK